MKENVNDGYIAVDLYGTLARYEGWQGDGVIGEPIAPMVERVKQWIREGKIVKVFTARVSSNNPTALINRVLIQDWCEKNIGTRLEVIAEKDYNMIELWDDRCVQVIPNTGIPVGGGYN